MDRKTKKSSMRTLMDNISMKKNLFITRMNILKQLNKNGNKVTFEVIQSVFNINIAKNEKKQNTNNNNYDINSYLYKEEDNTKNKVKKRNLPKEKKNDRGHTIKNISLIVILCLINIFIAVGAFDLTSNIKFNNVNEQFTEIISRSIKSPQTEIFLKSKFDEDKKSIIYYYEIVDNLDSYTYKIRNTDVDEELRISMLEKIAIRSKNIKNINSIKTTEYNTITHVGDYYIINNQYKIKEDNINGKEINLITSCIKNNNIREYQEKKILFISSSTLTLIILEGFVFYFNKKYLNKKKMQ